MDIRDQAIGRDTDAPTPGPSERPGRKPDPAQARDHAQKMSLKRQHATAAESENGPTVEKCQRAPARAIVFSLDRGWGGFERTAAPKFGWRRCLTTPRIRRRGSASVSHP